MRFTTELKIELIAHLREEFEDEPALIASVEAVPVGYDLTQVDRDPTWDDLVEDDNWVMAWLEYFSIVGP